MKVWEESTCASWQRFWRRAPVAMLGLALAYLWGSTTWAAPVAHIMRIDPRTSVQDGSPVLTTVIDLHEPRRISDAISPCAGLRGDEQLTCMSDALEKPGSLGTPHPLPVDKLLFSARVGDQDIAAEYLGHSRYGDSQQEPGIGTAWLIIVDADDRMDDGFDDAKAVAAQFITSLGPEDLVNLVFLSDRQIVSDTKWLRAGQRDSALNALEDRKDTIRSQGRTRPLLSLVRRAATDAFEALGNAGEGVDPPLHQAMVLISTGYGGGDPSTTGPGAAQLSEFLTRGRLVEDNTALPKLPLPVISIYVPPDAMAEHQQLARDFMQNLANPSIGGFFTVLQDGQADHAGRIVDTVRARFAHMLVARFRLSCVAPTVTQSFSLMFPGATPLVVGDNSFQDVPVGFDPSEWPLDIDREQTEKDAEKDGGVYPGGTLRVFGNFCWQGDTTRPEVYFLPPGESLPQTLGDATDGSKQVQKRLIALDMLGSAVQANANFAEFVIPDSPRLLHGRGEHQVVRFVVVDSKLGRTSGLTQNTVLQVDAQQEPIPVLPIALGGGAAILLLIALGFFFRRPQKSRAVMSGTPLPPRRGGASPYATPAPVSRGPGSSARVGTRATLEGPAGRFTVLAGTDLRVGRDGSRCAAVIDNPQVSGLHATFRFEQGRLEVRDEGSSTGTQVKGQAIEPHAWVELRDGVEVRLGPERIFVRLGSS